MKMAIRVVITAVVIFFAVVVIGGIVGNLVILEAQDSVSTYQIP